MSVFQITFCAFSTSQVIGGFVPSATPDAFGPRNDGQFCALAVMENDRINRERTGVMKRLIDMRGSVALETLPLAVNDDREL